MSGLHRFYVMMSQEEFDRFSIVPLLAASLLVVAPAILIVQETSSLPPFSRAVALLVTVSGVVGSYYWLTRDKMEFERDEATPDVFEVTEMDSNVEILLSEYEQLCEEIRYREQHGVNTTYFSVAIQALLANLLISVEPLARPLVSSIGLVLAFSFGMITSSYWLTRNRLVDRQKLIERRSQSDDLLTIYHTLRTERSPSRVDTVQIVSRVPEFHIFVTAIWLSVYLFFMIAFVFA